MLVLGKMMLLSAETKLEEPTKPLSHSAGFVDETSLHENLVAALRLESESYWPLI